MQAGANQQLPILVTDTGIVEFHMVAMLPPGDPLDTTIAIDGRGLLAQEDLEADQLAALGGLTVALEGEEIVQLTATQAQGVEAMLRVILHRQHIAHDEVYLARLLVDHLDKILQVLAPLGSHQSAGTQIDRRDRRCDAKRLRHLGFQLGDGGKVIPLNRNHIDRQRVDDTEELFVHGGYPLLSWTVSHYYPVSYFLGNGRSLKTGLFQPLALAIGLRYAGSRRSNRFVSFISLFSTFGIAIGVAALMVVISVMNGFEGQLKGRILGVIPQVVVTGSEGRLVPPAGLADTLSALPHVQAVAPMLATEGMLQSPGELTGVSVQGIDPKRWPADDLLHRQMQTGTLDTLTSGSYHIVLGQGVARTLGVSLGDQVRLLLTEGSRYTPFGRVPAQRLFTVSGIFGVGADVDNQIALINLSDAKRLLRLPAEEVGGLRLWLDDAFAVDSVVSQPLPEKLIWQDWRRERGELFQAVAMEKRMMGLMLVLIIAVATFNILSALVMVVGDKESEVAILRTMGMTESAVVRIFMVLGASSGVVGALAGGLAGLALTLGLNPLLSAIGLNLYMAAGGAGLPVIVEPLQVAVILLGAVLLSFSATLYPAARAARVRPAQALRYE